MDFEAMGVSLGIGDVIRARNITETELAKANAEIEKGNAEIIRLSKKVKELNGELGTKRCQAAGLQAYTNALVEALRKVDPNNDMLVVVGKHTNGTPKLKGHAIYESGFVEMAKKLGVNH